MGLGERVGGGETIHRDTKWQNFELGNEIANNKTGSKCHWLFVSLSYQSYKVPLKGEIWVVFMGAVLTGRAL